MSLLTSRASPEILNLDPVVWNHSGTVRVEAPLQSNHQLLDLEGPSPNSVLLIPGYGERKGAARAGLKKLADLGIPAVAALIDVRQVAATAPDIEAFVTEFGPMVRLELIERETMSLEDVAIGQSLGGGAIGLALREAPELFGDVGLMQPLGITTSALRESWPDDEARRREFTKRFRHVIYRGIFMDLLPDPITKLVTAGKELIGEQVMVDLLRPPLFQAEFSAASSVDIARPVLDHAVAGNQVALILGSKDPLIKADEARRSLYSYAAVYSPDYQEAIGDNLHIAVTKYQHTFMSWAGGRNHLQLVAEKLHI